MYTAHFLFPNNVDDMKGHFFQLQNMKLTLDELEKERDFYFRTLREIKVVCEKNDSERNPTIGKILDILYAAEVSLL
jgi:RP/EB family microtubule-associated protein